MLHRLSIPVGIELTPTHKRIAFYDLDASEFRLAIAPRKKVVFVEGTPNDPPEDLSKFKNALDKTVAESDYLLDAAVFSVPDNASTETENEFRTTLKKAGWNALRAVPRSFAALEYSSWTSPIPAGPVLVYDLAETTFSASLLRRENDEWKVLGRCEDLELGIAKQTSKAAELVLQHARGYVFGQPRSEPLNSEKIKVACDPSTHPSNRDRLERAARTILEELLSLNECRPYLPDLIEIDGQWVSVEVTLARTELDPLVEELAQGTLEKCRKLIAAHRDQFAENKGKVVILGSRVIVTPLLDRLASELADVDGIGLEVRADDPENAIVFGAALVGLREGMSYKTAFAPQSSEQLRGWDVSVNLETSPVATKLSHRLAGKVEMASGERIAEGGAVLVQYQDNGLTEELFLDEENRFDLELDLIPETMNTYAFSICDVEGQEILRFPVRVRHQGTTVRTTSNGAADHAMAKAILIEVVNRDGQPGRQLVVPSDATWPAEFRCTCHTADQSGQILVPLYQGDHRLGQVEVTDVPRELGVGSPVDIFIRGNELGHLTVEVIVRNTTYQGDTTLKLSSQSPGLTKEIVDQCRERIRESGNEALEGEFLEAVRFAPAQDVRAAMERVNQALANPQTTTANKDLTPEWSEFAKLVRQCLITAGEVADKTGQDRGELFEEVYAQEKYAEEAFEAKDQKLYSECIENLKKFALHLEQMQYQAHGGYPTNAPSPQEIMAAAANVEQQLKQGRAEARRLQREDLTTRIDRLLDALSEVPRRLQFHPAAAADLLERIYQEADTISKSWPTGQQSFRSTGKTGLLEGDI